MNTLEQSTHDGLEGTGEAGLRGLIGQVARLRMLAATAHFEQFAAEALRLDRRLAAGVGVAGAVDGATVDAGVDADAARLSPADAGIEDPATRLRAELRALGGVLEHVAMVRDALEGVESAGASLYGPSGAVQPAPEDRPARQG